MAEAWETEGQIREELPLSKRRSRVGQRTGPERVKSCSSDASRSGAWTSRPTRWPVSTRRWWIVIRELMDQPAGGDGATSLGSVHAAPSGAALPGVRRRFRAVARRRGGRRIAAHWPGGRWIGRREPERAEAGPPVRGQHRRGRRGVLATDHGAAANDPRLVSLCIIGPTRGIERPCCPGCCPATIPGGPRQAPSARRRHCLISAGGFFRNAARGRPPVGAYDASRGRPRGRAAGPTSSWTSPATRAQSRSAFAPADCSRPGTGPSRSFSGP